MMNHVAPLLSSLFKTNAHFRAKNNNKNEVNEEHRISYVLPQVLSVSLQRKLQFKQPCSRSLLCHVIVHIFPICPNFPL